MRNLLLGMALSLGMTAIGCGGTAPEEPIPPEQGTFTPPAPTGAPTQAPPATGTGTGSGTGTGTGTGTGSGTGTGTGTGVSSVPADCSVNEAEGNDSAADANAIGSAAAKFCGAISGAADVDFATFTLPADAKYLGFASSFTQSGVDFDVTVDGKTFTVGETPIVKAGAVYTVKAYTKGKTPVSYKLSVDIRK